MIYNRTFCVAPALLALSIVFQWGCGGSEPVGEIQVLKGSAVVSQGSNHTRLTTDKRLPIHLGDTVATETESEAVVRSGQEVQYLRASTEIRFDSASVGGPAKGAGCVTLLKGMAWFLLPKSEPKAYKFQVSVGNVIAAVKGTAFSLETTSDGMNINTLRGEVDIISKKSDDYRVVGLTQSKHLMSTVKGGQQASYRGGAIAPTPLSPADSKRLEAEIFILENQNITISNF